MKNNWGKERRKKKTGWPLLSPTLLLSHFKSASVDPGGAGPPDRDGRRHALNLNISSFAFLSVFFNNLTDLGKIWHTTIEVDNCFHSTLKQYTFLYLKKHPVCLPILMAGRWSFGLHILLYLTLVGRNVSNCSKAIVTLFFMWLAYWKTNDMQIWQIFLRNIK